MITRIICIAMFMGLSLSSIQKATAQIVDLKHAAYLDLGGTAGIWSLNYDLMALNINNFKVGARLGFGFLTEGYAGSSLDLHIPITANFLYTFGEKHHIELGIGTQVMSYEIRSVKTATDSGFERKTEALGNYTIGYRFQPANGGVVFRIFYSPFFYQDGLYFRYEHWGGLSIGYAFKSGKKDAK